LRKLVLLLGVLVALIAAPSALAPPPTSILCGDVDIGTGTHDGTRHQAGPR
jgi:hypothetical protein